jgi:hypothetical protein
MKFLILIVLTFFLSLELHTQPLPLHKLKFSNKSPKNEIFYNLSFGLGFAKAIQFSPDEHNRNHDLRFLANVNMTLKIYNPLYMCLGLEYSKKDLDGTTHSLNMSILPSLAGNAFHGKVNYFTEIGLNVVSIYYPSDRMIQFSPGLTIGLKVQYNITKKYAVGIDIRHLNYFNIWSEHYFIVHSNLYFAVRI